MKKDIFILSVFTFFLLIFPNSSIKTDYSDIEAFIYDSIPQEITSLMEYGLEIDSFLVEEGIITPNLFLSTLFSNYNIPQSKIASILEKTIDVFDVKKINRGNKYKVFCTKDTARVVQYIVYERNAKDYVVFDFTDTLAVYNGQKQVITKTMTGSGIIESCLWLTMNDNDINPLLASKLSEIYAWSIDFFGLQEGDKFKVIYEEKYINDESIGIDDIDAAYFEHNGKEIYAIPFFQDSVMSFFDLDGNSLRKAFLKAPLNYSHISSGFSNSRLHPILKIYRPHYGVDYAAPLGTPVLALGDGVVCQANYSSSAGYMIKIKHNGVYTTGYLHLSKFAPGIYVGANVSQGDVIGYVGSTGLSTGPHLDFRVWMNNEPVDPLTIDAPPVEPIKDENRGQFEKTKKIIAEKLNNIQYKNEVNKERNIQYEYEIPNFFAYYSIFVNTD